MGKRLCEIKNMHNASHVCVDQTDKFEVTGTGKSDSKALSLYNRRSADAGGAIEAAGSASRKAWATRLKSQPYLARPLKGHGMDLVGIECPGDVIARVNPELVGKKSQGLTPQRFTLASNSGAPLGLCYLWKDQDDECEYRKKDPRAQAS
jgi:hypothetical protein